jgi:hypothetical protein
MLDDVGQFWHMALFAKVMGESRTEHVYGIIRKGVSISMSINISACK